MNYKGQVTIFTLMLAVVVIILAMAFAYPLKQQVDIARNVTNTNSNITTIGLDCDNTSISDFDKASCVSVDLFTPYFIGGLIALAGVVLTARLFLTGD